MIIISSMVIAPASYQRVIASVGNGIIIIRVIALLSGGLTTNPDPNYILYLSKPQCIMYSFNNYYSSKRREDIIIPTTTLSLYIIIIILL